MVGGQEHGRPSPVNPADTVIGYIKRFPTLNTDVSVTRDGMPQDLSGKAAFGVLRDRGFANLGAMLERVHAGAPKIISRPQTRLEYRRASVVVSDLVETLRANEERLLDQAVVGERQFNDSRTTIYELVLTFYETLHSGGIINLQRARALSEQGGFVLSPMMQEALLP
jgi:hypothetical protein